MPHFILFFRMDITTKEVQPTPEQMEDYMAQWKKWTDGIAAKNKLVGGNHLSVEGKVLRSKGVITDGPYVETSESIAGYIIIKAENLDDAVKIAEKCPILQGEDTSVEVRQIANSE
jgi:hypothetical protein